VVEFSIANLVLFHLPTLPSVDGVQRPAVVLRRAAYKPPSYPPTLAAGTKASVTVSAINHLQHRSSHKASWLVRTPASSFFWLMSVSVGGISLLSPWSSLFSWDDTLHPRTGLRSFVCALVFITVILILGELHRSNRVMCDINFPHLPSLDTLSQSPRWTNATMISISHESRRSIFQNLPHRTVFPPASKPS